MGSYSDAYIYHESVILNIREVIVIFKVSVGENKVRASDH